MSLFAKSIDASILASAKEHDLRGRRTASLTDTEFCRLTSCVDYWDDENDRFAFMLRAGGTSSFGPSHACFRIRSEKISTEGIDNACHAKVSTYSSPNTRIILPLQWCVWQEQDRGSSMGPFNLGPFIRNENSEQRLPAESASAYSKKFVRDFYEWLSKPDQNPILANAMKYTKDWEWYRTDEGLLYGVSFTVVKSHISIFNFCAQTRAVTDGFYGPMITERAKQLKKWRDLGFSMRVCFVIAEGYASMQSAGGHLSLAFDEYNMFNWLTDNPIPNPEYWNNTWIAKNKYPLELEGLTEKKLTKYLENLKKEGFKIGPTHAK